MKYCSNINCKQTNPQPLSGFSRDPNRKDGHNFKCKRCHKEYRTSNKERIANKKAQYALRNKEKISEYMVAYQAVRYEKNKEKLLKQSRSYKNLHKREVALKKLQWRKNNPGKYAAYCAKRRAQKALATPPWLTKEQHIENEMFYIKAFEVTKETGIPHEVDHIEPLQGENVKGLHVPWNLRVIPRSINRRKTNKSIP